MLRLVETDFTPTGKSNLGDRSPSCFLHVRTVDTLRSERCDLSREIVADEIELMSNSIFGGMDGNLRRRQCEDQPLMAGIHRREFEDVAEERAIGLRILAVHDHMGAKDHELTPHPENGAENLAGTALGSNVVRG